MSLNMTLLTVLIRRLVQDGTLSRRSLEDVLQTVEATEGERPELAPLHEIARDARDATDAGWLGSGN